MSRVRPPVKGHAPSKFQVLRSVRYIQYVHYVCNGGSVKVGWDSKTYRKPWANGVQYQCNITPKQAKHAPEEYLNGP
jgi:hypothetical protein